VQIAKCRIVIVTDEVTGKERAVEGEATGSLLAGEGSPMEEAECKRYGIVGGRVVRGMRVGLDVPGSAKAIVGPPEDKGLRIDRKGRRGRSG